MSFNDDKVWKKRRKRSFSAIDIVAISELEEHLTHFKLT